MKSYIFDCETDGLLDELTKLHSLVLQNVETGEVTSCADKPNYIPIKDGLAMLAEADKLIGHNIICFDLPALEKVYGWKPKDGCVIRDTMVCTHLIWPKDILKDRDFRLVKKGKLPGNLVGRQSLEAWGWRLGNYKGDFKGPWAQWSKNMQDYCEQDVSVTATLWKRICQKIAGRAKAGHDIRDALQLEHDTRRIIFRQEQHGFKLNTEKASDLYAEIAQKRLTVKYKLKEAFLPWWTSNGITTPKKSINYKDILRPDLTKDAPYTKIKLAEFNPASRHHITYWLTKKYDWEPAEWNEDGTAKCDEASLSGLPYPEAKLLCEYLMLNKRVSQIAEGKEAWLKHEKNGRVHGRIITNSCVTGRMSHRSPNMGQVPAAKKRTGEDQPYGKECRDCWEASEGLKLVGIDADSLELRDLAGYMAKWDKGAYAEAVIHGSKSDGTDIHSINAKALGVSREMAKTWFYAFIYGAGNFKLGLILQARGSPRAISMAGKRSREKFEKNLPALGKLVEAVKRKARKKGFLLGLDNRRLYIRSQHAALNTLLQSAGAVQMKRALVIFDNDLITRGYVPGVDYEFVANVHDEWQVECKPEIAEEIGEAGSEAIRLAGEYYRFPCPLSGSYDIGNSWAETH